MGEPRRITSETTYAQALAVFAEAWPSLPVIWYRPTVEHYKEGRPTAEDLELAPGEAMGRTQGNEVILRGDMTGQGLHNAIMRAFSIETEMRGFGIRGIWLVTLDEANSRDSAGA